MWQRCALVHRHRRRCDVQHRFSYDLLLAYKALCKINKRTMADDVIVLFLMVSVIVKNDKIFNDNKENSNSINLVLYL